MLLYLILHCKVCALSFGNGYKVTLQWQFSHFRHHHLNNKIGISKESTKAINEVINFKSLAKQISYSLNFQGAKCQ
jgi:hypothetical protein